MAQPAQNGAVATPRTPALEKTDPFAPKKPAGATPSPAAATGQENKDAWDYQKKVALQAGPHLRLEKGYYDTYDMPESLFTVLKDLFEAIIAYQSRIGIITPTKFLEVLRRNHEVFRSNFHQDAHEFLITLLSVVVDEVERYSKTISADPQERKGLGLELPALTTTSTKEVKATSSWVHELFEGTLTSETRCLTCENISQRDEAFLDLSVDLEEHSSVTSCLRKFSEEEMLCERNKFHCDKCGGLQEAEKRMKIKRLPRVLALHLKRFKYIEEVNNMRKLFHRVVYPFHLRILNTTDDVEDPDRLYELYAVVVHLGSTPFHGHYVAIIKTQDRGWLLFDDELVLPVDKDYVRNFFGGDPRNPACAYVLFYQETTEEAVQREQENEEDVADIPTAEGFDSQGMMNTATTVGARSPALTAETAPTPMVEELDPFTSRLEHAATAPSPPHDGDIIEEEDIQPRLSNEEREKSYLKGPLGSIKKGGGNFNRFRNSSLSMKGKPKFWQSPKDRDAERSEGLLDPDGSPAAPAEVKESQTDKEKAEKKSRFSLGRKKG